MSRKTISKPSSAEAEEARRAAFEGEVPPLGKDFFERARIRIGNRIIREADGTFTKRGRPPKGERAKVQQSLRLSPEVLEHFRAGGPGWQARIDEVLRRHVAEAAPQAKVAEEREGYDAEKGK
ncbi:MAG: BrnA antitoxin family protein [Alphaproteobacteria bacterium]|nr:BrnA antitoxin family protein [Alphaproteobacteria bacterium]